MLSLAFRLLSIFALAFASPHGLVPRQVVNATVELNVPSVPAEGRQVVDAAFQSYSIEFSYMADYAGNFTNPNHFSIRMLQNLADISGAYPIIRAGGSTQDRVTWVQNQTVGVINIFDTPGEDQPNALTIGPAWFQSFQTFPKGTRYIYGLSFYNGTEGLQQTLDEAGPAFWILGESLYAYEIGNEVDGFPCDRRPCNWTMQDYVNEWLFTAAYIGNTSIGTAVDKIVEPLFQGGVFEAPRGNLNSPTSWNVKNALLDGIDSTGRVKTMSDHDYMGSACPGTTQIATIQGNLLNHFHMTSLMWYHSYLANYSVSVGVPYVIGETNSISCQGQVGVSDVFAAAIWSVDYVLYVATLEVSRIYFHQGTPYRYSAWQPIDINSTSLARPYPLYYGNLFTSTALAGGNKQVDILVNSTYFTVYAIYEASEREQRLDSIAVVNLNMWNSTEPAAERPYNAVELPEWLDCSRAKVRRLTAPGVEIATNITWAGQYVESDGNIVGREVTEDVQDGKVLVGAGEAVLISFDS